LYAVVVMQTDVAVIGGSHSGEGLAEHLHKLGFALVLARPPRWLIRHADCLALSGWRAGPTNAVEPPLDWEIPDMSETEHREPPYLFPTWVPLAVSGLLLVVWTAIVRL
jgi:hypothetical protein